MQRKCMVSASLYRLDAEARCIATRGAVECWRPERATHMPRGLQCNVDTELPRLTCLD